MNQEEIFETGGKENEVKEINDEETTVELPEEPKKFIKEKKKRKPLSEEQKNRLKEQLKKGRETSLANRQKKAKLKAIDKEEKVTADDEKIYNSIKKKKESTLDNSNLLNEIELLKQKLKEKEEAEVVEPPPKKVRKPRAKKVVNESVNEPEKTYVKKEKVVEEAPSTKASVQQPKPLTARQIAKMMKNLR